MKFSKEKLVFLDPGGDEITGSWRLVGENLIWRIADVETVIPSNDDLGTEVENLLESGDPISGVTNLVLKACLTCKHFQMSGMARDMGRGQRGVCLFHRQGVELCHLCDNYVGIESK